MRIELELRNLPRFRIFEYLAEAGGCPEDDRTFTGVGWTAELRPMFPAQVGQLTVRRDLLILDGDECSVTDLHVFMRRKTMRGGGSALAEWL